MCPKNVSRETVSQYFNCTCLDFVLVVIYCDCKDVSLLCWVVARLLLSLLIVIGHLVAVCRYFRQRIFRGSHKAILGAEIFLQKWRSNSYITYCRLYLSFIQALNSRLWLSDPSLRSQHFLSASTMCTLCSRRVAGIFQIWTNPCIALFIPTA